MAQFPQIPDLNLPVHERIGVPNMNVPIGKWDVANPHPNLGKDPNIGNEFGHTFYPKMLYIDTKPVVVNNAEEEAIALGGTLNNGPTIQEWVAAGYKASNYPPAGYESKSTEEEINEAIAEEIKEAQAKMHKSGWGK
jgi:hypothetical protein